MKKNKVKQTSDVPHHAAVETTGVIKRDHLTTGGHHHVYGRDQGAY